LYFEGGLFECLPGRRIICLRFSCFSSVFKWKRCNWTSIIPQPEIETLYRFSQTEYVPRLSRRQNPLRWLGTEETLLRLGEWGPRT
jgi:hypothetical protein